MKLSNIASTVIATLALVAGAAHAEDTATPVSVNGGTVHFKGELVNAACSVNTDLPSRRLIWVSIVPRNSPKWATPPLIFHSTSN
jgi:hypothetical protein